YGGGEGFREAARAEDAAIADAPLFGGGPEAEDGLAGQMDERVAAGNVGHSVEGEAPHLTAGERALWVAGKGDDFVAAAQVQVGELAADEAAGAGDADVHGRTFAGKLRFVVWRR